MRRIKSIIIVLLFVTASVSSSAQNDFFFHIYGGSTNLWSSAFLQIPSNFVNSMISSAIDDEDGISASLRYEIFHIKNAGKKVELDQGSYWGFKSKDMFSNVQYGLKFGWQPELSPFGIYISCAYQFSKFRVQFDPEVDIMDKFKVHSIRPGIGIRITPFINMLEDRGWSPILEVGTSYNYYLNCTAPYENKKGQLNSGMVSTFAIGARLYENCSISAGLELDHYSMFNKDFTPDDGVTYPYKDVKTDKMTIFLAISHDF